MLINLIRSGVVFGIILQYAESSVNVARQKPALQSSLYRNFGPELAVDGNAASTFLAKSCCHTATNQRTAWWRVDLQALYRINRILITYRRETPTRMDGFYLYVSNTTDFQNGHLCYHDNVPGNPNTVQNIGCDVIGRYVTFYNERPRPQVFVELCEVEVYGCLLNKYGPNCEETCACFTGGCNLNNGTCDVPGCQDGFVGAACNQACRKGKYGKNCLMDCGHCSNGETCNRFSGVCENGCASGWISEKCNISCGNNTFGVDCRHQCHCKTGGCNTQTGICDVPGCEDGYLGSSCDTACGTAKYGMDCQLNCGHCLNGETCNRFSGVCEKGCASGWLSEKCNVSCDNNTFGVGCNHQCHCKMGQCNTQTGICDVPGCEDGYMGSSCNTACGKGTYGRDCLMDCGYCLNGETCNRFSGVCEKGCASGWISQNCNISCDNNTFGIGCKHQCHCKTGGCNAQAGICDVPGCEHGYAGSSCDTGCVKNTYGRDCLMDCGHCLNGETCNRFSGVCDKGCASGWISIKCNISCDNNTFGVDCKHQCHCKTGGCNTQTGQCDVPGCEDGYKGSSCDTVISPIQILSTGHLSVYTVIVSSVVTACIVLLIISIVFVIYKKYKRNKHEAKQKQMVYRNLLESENIYEIPNTAEELSSSNGATRKKCDEELCKDAVVQNVYS